jgi:hypothetical protein
MPDPIQQYEDADGNIVGSVYGADDGAFVIEDDSGTAVRLTTDGITNAAGDPIGGSSGGGASAESLSREYTEITRLTPDQTSEETVSVPTGYDFVKIVVNYVPEGLIVQVNGHTSNYRNKDPSGGSSFSGLVWHADKSPALEGASMVIPAEWGSSGFMTDPFAVFRDVPANNKTSFNAYYNGSGSQETLSQITLKSGSGSQTSMDVSIVGVSITAP